MKKSLLVLILFLLAPTLVVAQTPIEREIEQLGLKSVSFTIASPDKAVGSVKTSEPKFSVDIDHVSITIEPNTEHDTNVLIEARITNLTDFPLPIGFVRNQTLPKYWKTSVCFGINCYADWVSAVDSAAVAWEPHETRELILHVRTPPGAQGVGEVLLNLFEARGTDTVKVRYSATMLDVPVTQCRTFWFDNPYNGEVKFQEIKVENPELFDVEVLNDTSYALYPTDIMAVRLCLKQADGKEHTTKVIFVTDSGTFEQAISLVAPTSEGVMPSANAHGGIRIVSVSPNPAAASQSLQINLQSDRATDLNFSIVDLLGREIRSLDGISSIGVSSPRISILDLNAGSYILLVKENGQVLDQMSFSVSR
jgi:hypothetical protein